MQTVVTKPAVWFGSEPVQLGSEPDYGNTTQGHGQDIAGSFFTPFGFFTPLLIHDRREHVIAAANVLARYLKNPECAKNISPIEA